MILNSIELLSYRNYSHLILSFDPNINIFIGPNGAGKTNLLEAIYLLSSGELKRGRKDTEAISWNEPFTWIRGEVSYEDGRVLKLVTQVKDDGEKAFSVNGKITPLKRYLGSFYTISIFDNDYEIVTGSPDKRRAFLDEFVINIDPEYYFILNRYKDILIRRNRLLRTKNFDRRLLDSLTELLIELGEKIIIGRHRTISTYNRYLKREGERFGIDVKIEASYITEDIEESLKIYKERFNSSRAKEEVIGITLVGPHRDDILIKINNKDSRSFASNGEVQVILFLLKIAQLELIRELKGYKPVLLIDEFLNRLDERNIKTILSAIEEKSPQLFVSMISKKEIGVHGTIFSIDRGDVIDEESF
ncbi:MAG: DNA replication and repair protein RecF [bacterium]|nr:DNA replication and repair protein RecF [bacterium]